MRRWMASGHAGVGTDAENVHAAGDQPVLGIEAEGEEVAAAVGHALSAGQEPLADRGGQRLGGDLEHLQREEAVRQAGARGAGVGVGCQRRRARAWMVAASGAACQPLDPGAEGDAGVSSEMRARCLGRTGEPAGIADRVQHAAGPVDPATEPALRAGQVLHGSGGPESQPGGPCG